MIDVNLPLSMRAHRPDEVAVPRIWKLEYRGPQLWATTSLPSDDGTPPPVVMTRIEPSTLQLVPAPPAPHPYYESQAVIECPK